MIYILFQIVQNTEKERISSLALFKKSHEKHELQYLWA